MDSQWPAHFPSGCPPIEAVAASGMVYRIVANAPPQAKEFRSVYEKNPSKYAADCRARGLSVHKDRTELQKLLRTVPAMKKLGEHIASAALEAAHGKLKATPSGRGKSHCTWWVTTGIEPCTLFSIVES